MNAPASARREVVVIGAGVVGVATAHALASLGASVCIVDRECGPGDGASFANGAQLSYAYADALAAPALIGRLPVLALGLDPLFRLRLAPDPGLYAWLAAFLRNMTRSRFEQNTCEVLALALQSRREMEALLSRHPIAFHHAVPGKMHLLYGEDGLRAARATLALKQRRGVVQDILTAEAAIAIEPALAQVRGLAGVVYSPRDAVGDARLFCRGLLELCERELGVEARFGSEVTGILRESDGWRISFLRGEALSARRLILCAGEASRAIARGLGLDLPIQPMKGYSFTAPLGPDAPRVSLTDTRRKIGFCRLGERIRVAGLAEVGARSPALDPARAALLRDLARQALPNAADYDAVESEWAGLRPMTPNSQPITRWVDPTLALNTGHGMLGWTLAMGSAARIARTAPALSS
jgi:D-amino-acid dehydrogenase